MEKITLTMACAPTDRSRPILDGRVEIPGCRIVALPGEPQDIFRRALRDRAFEITELSMGNHILATAKAQSHYVGVPVFLSRAFRHSAIYVRTDRGIRTPADLKGKRVGMTEFQQTASLWLRGILADEYGLARSDVAWRTGGLNQPSPPPRSRLELSVALDVEAIPATESLDGLLAKGEIDAVFSTQPPRCFASKSAPVDRLFPDYRAAETAYYKSSGVFPIMHCLTVRNDVAEAHPWLALELFRAFTKAKALSLNELTLVNTPRVALPWVAQHFADTLAVLGPNPWPYGLKQNRPVLEAMVRYAAADGLLDKQFDPAQLFHPSTLDATDPG